MATEQERIVERFMRGQIWDYGPEGQEAWCDEEGEMVAPAPHYEVFLDALRAALRERDGQIKELSDGLDVARGERDEWRHRSLAAEAEIARLQKEKSEDEEVGR